MRMCIRPEGEGGRAGGREGVPADTDVEGSSAVSLSNKKQASKQARDGGTEGGTEGRREETYLLTAMLMAMRSARSFIRWPINSAVSPPMAWQTR